MRKIEMINDNLAKFAEKVPAKGMHISYLNKAVQIMDLYGDALCIMEDERTAEREADIAKISDKIDEIVR